MKKYVSVSILMGVVLSLCSCANDIPAIDEIYDELSSFETATAEYITDEITVKEPSISVTETTCQEIDDIIIEDGIRFDGFQVLGVDEDLFNLIDAYSCEFDIPNKWKKEIDQLGILNWLSTSVYQVKDYIIIKTYGDVEWVGNMQGPDFYLVIGDDVYIELSPSGYAHEPWYCISEDMIYIYEYNFSGGVIHIILTSYKLETGETVFLYDAVYGLKSTELADYSVIPNEVKTTRDLQEYMLDISDVWYK